MVSKETRERFSRIYRRMDRQSKGITIEDDLYEEIQNCGGRTKGEGYCSAHKCKCGSVNSCEIPGKNSRFEIIHGDASYGEVKSWKYMDEL